MFCEWTFSFATTCFRSSCALEYLLRYTSIYALSRDPSFRHFSRICDTSYTEDVSAIVLWNGIYLLRYIA